MNEDDDVPVACVKPDAAGIPTAAPPRLPVCEIIDDRRLRSSGSSDVADVD